MDKTSIEERNMWLACGEASTLSAENVESRLNVNPLYGLSSLEVSRRRDIHGFNEVSVGKPEPLWKKYLDQFNNPFILLLLLSAFISVCMQQFDDACSITVAIVIVVTVGFVQEYRSEKTLEKMGALLPPTCHVLRDGSTQQILAKQLVPGDVVLLTVGDRIPADVRLFEVNELAVDESSFTGEPISKRKMVQVIEKLDAQNYKNMDISDMKNIGFQGTLVTDGKGVGVVISTGENSQFGEIFKVMKSEETPRTPLQKSMDVLGKQLTAYSLGVIGLIMLIGSLLGQPIMHMFNVGVSLAVAAIPEGLPIVVTVTLAFGVMRMAKRNAVIKRLPTVEALGCVDVICSDKTGTLTANNMVVYCSRTAANVVGSIHSVEESSSKENDTSGEEIDLTALLEVCMLCNNAQMQKLNISNEEGSRGADRMYSGSATEKALLKYGVDRGGEKIRSEFERISELPFSSDRKYMAVQCQHKSNTDERNLYFVKGAVEEILAKCSSILVHGSGLQIAQTLSDAIYSCTQVMASQGLRVLALARGNSPEALQFVGLVGLHDPPREGVKASVQRLQGSRVKVCMITGDAKETAAAVAESLGISRPNQFAVTCDPSVDSVGKQGELLLSGSEIDDMTDAALAQVADMVVAYYRATPLHKLRIVKALQVNINYKALTLLPYA